MWLIDSLPIHPLVVHAPVVLVPMLVAGLVLFLVSPRSRPLVSLVVAVLAVGAAVTSVLAVASGGQLSEQLRLGDRVSTHESRGELVRLLSIVLAVGAGLLAAWQRSSQAHIRHHAARWLGGSLVPVALVATLAVIGTGHSGAQLVWEDSVIVAPAGTTPLTGTGSPTGSTPGPGTDPGTVTGSTAPGDTVPPTLAAPAVEVVLGEWTLLSDLAATAPGSVPFRIRNAGVRVHTLRIRSEGGGDGRFEWRSPELQSGETLEATVDLPAGGYELTCSIEDSAGDHADLGMVAPFTVRAGAPIPTAPTLPVTTVPVTTAPSNPANPANPGSTPSPSPVSVAIKAFAFQPATVNVAVGQSVVWTNQDPAPHTATGNGFDTGSLGLGASATSRFNTRGRFEYICDIHPAMTGTVVVQ
ncbi:MAG: cupredoxin domain-containing protein [Acidimicrobiales bacterium]